MIFKKDYNWLKITKEDLKTKIIWFKDHTLLEDKVDRLINIHSKKGFGVVSACRRDKTNEENLKRTEQLKKDLSELDWSYTIGYGGGFQKNGNEEGFDISKPKFNEISVIVYNHNRKNEKVGTITLKLSSKETLTASLTP